jgi:RNA polymerase sigma factor (sigma-70 family)
MNIIQRLVRQRLYSSNTESIADADLLTRFLRERDEAAFELLVHRHGSMVLGLCRKVIGDQHDAEDAFQATFLMLARRAGTIHQRRSLGSWLYKVAYRLAFRCRSRVKQHALLSTLPDLADTVTLPECVAQSTEESTALVEELDRLSERLRSVVILCCFQGKSSSEAARQLGCPINTVSTRLFRAREQLKKSLVRRGILYSGSIAALAGTDSIVSPAMAQSLAALAGRSISGAPLTSLVAPSVSALVQGSASPFLWKPILFCTLLLGAFGWLAWNSPAPSIDDEVAAQQPVPAASSPIQLQVPPLQNLSRPNLLPLVSQPAEENKVVEMARFDVDGDASDDIVESYVQGHGVASTYWANYQVRANPGYKFLKSGLPLAQGESISAADVMNGVEVIHLCTNSSSFMVNMTKEQAQTGPWSGKKAALGMARVKDNVLSLGYVVMTVTHEGQITIHESHWEPVESNQLTVSLNSQDDVADIKSQEFQAGNDARKKYMLIAPDKGAPPAEGYGLILVLPGGDGGMGFHPFIKRIFKNGIPEGYVLAQPVAKKWTANQQIIWPTEKNKVPEMKFTTEEFINAVIEDVSGRKKINPARVFTLTWSSSGPAGYAASLTCSKVTGSFVAMSVFNPRYLPALDKASKHPYFVYHSPDDRTCPIRMAQQAVTDLGKAGAKVELKTYDGGHGWRGPLYEDIRTGIEWLEKNARQP